MPKETDLDKAIEFLKPILDEDSIDNLQFYHGKGCDECNNRWYKWRIWIHEVLILEEYMEPLILNTASDNEIKEEAVKHWMITIVQDALLKALLWETTVEEALKLI